MSRERWVVLGLAHPRAVWFGEVSQWSNSASIPVEFVKCVSVSELNARISGSQPFSALLIGADVAGLDRDMIDRASRCGTCVIAVGDRIPPRLRELGILSLIHI